jgi:hypothetical protein
VLFDFSPVLSASYSSESLEQKNGMSQRESGYERKALDLYETPEWVTLALRRHLRPLEKVWEPAAGGGKMARALETLGFRVEVSDIATGDDFLSARDCDRACAAEAIITNPPYSQAQQFIEHGLKLMQPTRGLIAMLLRTDYDHAATRQHLFSDCNVFAKKLVLTKRIVWFDGPKAAPSFNHAWYIWDWRHAGPPILAYGP